MTVGSLCTGVGMIDLAFTLEGFDIMFQAEIEEHACEILKRRWPDVPNLGDIKNADYNNYKPDILVAGIPCQPVSLAGQGKATSDERWLWPDMHRAIRCCKPQFVLLENVSGLLAGNRGFASVLADLSESGYDAEWETLPAAAFGATHKRDRVFLVAYPNGFAEPQEDQATGSLGGYGKTWDDVSRLDWGEEPSSDRSVSASEVHRKNDGPADRLDRHRELGNGVHVQTVRAIARRIKEVMV